MWTSLALVHDIFWHHGSIPDSLLQLYGGDYLCRLDYTAIAVTERGAGVCNCYAAWKLQCKNANMVLWIVHLSFVNCN